jgi:hypothetical protein
MDFTLFPKLALELQDAIWGFALPPRTITITSTCAGYGNEDDVIHKFEADTGPIATELLHTCACSRCIALSQYEPTFEFKFGAPFYVS